MHHPDHLSIYAPRSHEVPASLILAPPPVSHSHSPAGPRMRSIKLLPTATPQGNSPRWLGSKKFAIPSLILYSCPQLPHTSLPSITSVCRSRVCKSRSVFSSSDDGGVGTSGVGIASSEGAAAVGVGSSVGAAAEERAGSGLESGTVKPSCVDGGS